ncbi:Transcription initiation factor TFIID subunit 14b, variant 3 [Lathyrus oleraceus]|uniref:Transcription initiation factor TFIID subunit 14b, variant 3 n=1 Tax=Pisum sativum TaxID=3888 RepID=A0A9D4VT09_PEA|nr:Transcription initiation factor TFIID subunit 14b, variant 3 [Pisum sativum]
MPNSSSSKKHGQDQPEFSGPIPISLRTKMGKSEDNDKKNSSKKVKDVEISVPIVYGNIAFWLGKKASEYHHLKLYPEDENSSMSTKKPVVVESYDEVVFPDPSEAFLARLQNHPVVNLPRLPPGLTLPPPIPVEDASKRRKGDTKDNPLSQWFLNFSEADELLQLAAARQQVQTHISKLKRQITLIDGQHKQQQQLKSSSDQ